MHWVGYDQVFKSGTEPQEINVNQLSNYKELWQEIACMFKLNVNLNDPDLGWRLVYANNGKRGLVGDHPWEYITLLF